MQTRIEWIDLAKGVGIILVVVGHAGRGLQNAGLADPRGVLPVLDQAIYAFHMPLFFLLSGVVFGVRPVHRVTPDLLKRVWRVFYPMILWTYVFLAMRVVAGSSSNTQSSLRDMFVLPLPPVEHFWFLWALLLNFVIFSILRMGLRPFLSEVQVWILAVLFAAIANFAIKLPPDLFPYFGQAVHYSIAFALGALLGALPLASKVPRPAIALLSLLLFAVILWVSVALEFSLHWIVQGIALSLLLLPPLVFASSKIDRMKLGKGVSYLGVISLAIYVMHTMFSAALRILLVKLGTDDLTLHLVFGSAIGIIGPVIVYRIARRYGASRYLGLG